MATGEFGKLKLVDHGQDGLGTDSLEVSQKGKDPKMGLGERGWGERAKEGTQMGVETHVPGELRLAILWRKCEKR